MVRNDFKESMNDSEAGLETQTRAPIGIGAGWKLFFHKKNALTAH